MTNEERPRILWIHPGGLLPVGGGGAARTWALIDYLREQGFAVELLTGDQGVHNGDLEARLDRLWIEQRSDSPTPSLGIRSRLREGLKTVYRSVDPELRLLRQFSGRVGSLIPMEDNLLIRNRRPALEHFAATVAYADPPLAAIASYAWLAPALDHMPPGTLRILDTIDIQHERRDNAATAGGNLDHVQCARDDEIRELNRADILLAIQAEEGETLKTMCPDKAVIVAEHAHTVSGYTPSPEDSRELLYVGNRYDPNVLGLRAILEKVWPSVRERCPSAHLTVCGRVGESLRGRHPGATVAGQVPDLSPYYARAAVVLNPVPYGTGLKIKTVEGLAHGRAVVCTSAGAGGLGDPAQLPLLVSEAGGEMADQIARLLEDVAARHELEKQAWEYARDRFAPEQVYGALLARLKQAHEQTIDHG